MRSAAAFIAERQTDLLTSAVVIRPWDYVRLRREAAGLSIEQAARRFYSNEDHRADCEQNLRMFERPGVTIRDIRAVNLGRAFPFDPVVYEQLAELPADRQPRVCRGCGWDQCADQVDLQGYQCTWSQSDSSLCTRCDQLGPERRR